MRPTASDGGKLSTWAMVKPSSGFTRYCAKYPTKIGAGRSAHLLKSFTVSVRPMANMRKPNAPVNTVDENQVTAVGLATPIAAPRNTHNGNKVARRSASFSRPDGSAGISADAARDFTWSTRAYGARWGHSGTRLDGSDNRDAQKVRAPVGKRDLHAPERPCAGGRTVNIPVQQRALESRLLCCAYQICTEGEQHSNV